MKRFWYHALQVSACSLAALFGASVFGEDWPHWMGPTRDNVWKVDNALTSFPASGLQPRWTASVAGGYSGPAVVGNRVYVTDLVTTADAKVDNFGRRTFDGTERVLCMDDSNGKIVWKYEYPVTYSISYPAGPRCTPIVDDGKLYTLGAEGDLYCFDAAKGTVVWSKNLKKAYNTNSALWGYAAHPLIDGNKLITIAGGDGSHTVCLDKKNGNEIWKTGTAKEVGYVPPSIIEAGGKRQLIVPSGMAVNSVDPETGKPYWSLPYEASNGSIIMTPIQQDSFLFIGGYSKKNMLIQLDKTAPKAKVLWQDLAKKAVSPVNVQPIRVGNIIYGFDETGEMIAFEIESGKRLWETSKPISSRPVGSGTAFIVRSGELFYLFNESGELIIAKLSPSGYEELARTKLIEPTNNAFGRDVVWCAPAFANGSIYVRNDEKLISVKLTK